MIAMPLSAHDPDRISARDAADMVMRHLDGVLPELAVFDVRDAAQYAAAHIPGASHLTEIAFPGVVRSLARHTPVLVYCYHGNASQQWAQTFSDFRFAEAWSVDDGYEAFAAELALRCIDPVKTCSGVSLERKDTWVRKWKTKSSVGRPGARAHW
ncbi:rhodanese-like domain-containing protein [Cognatazoarcus halotolerans]|uniref:rhodanese-like domain-containing protein n=1 Tax=Cognatazoarcus halotolerans TaxID=2686016 RepID=UPI00135B8F03|nr:rhodanese-like domain-containing protein [Cognatazoarcus halotolerans]